jgi:cytochrome c heme-lyase
MGGGISKHQDDVIKTKPLQDADEVQTNDKSEQETSKCPMHQGDGSYSWDWTQMLKAAAVHGPSGSKPLATAEKVQEPPDDVGGGCPVKHSTPHPKNTSSGCPVKHDDSRYPEYNVYSQPIDKTNQMPKGVRTQMPTPTQKAEISTERVKSSIPKGGETEDGTTWTYPSPQQFYNALSRKGKLGDDTSEEDMDSVVALHNNMNEKTWAQVVEWEKQTYKSDATPKLLKFMGRPHDLSPKATLKHYLLGHPLPYDRHDWTVLRDDGSTVRYVIDYYYDETRARETEDSALPSKDDREATPSLLVDVRPALDGPTHFVARAVQMPYKLFTGQTAFKPLPLRGTPDMAKQVQESLEVWQSIQNARKQELKDQASVELSQAEAEQIALRFSQVLKECRTQQSRVISCQSDEDCSRASMDLTMCMGPILCQVQHNNLKRTLAENDDDKIEAALETLSECVVHQTAQRALAKNQHPSIFKN